MHVVDTGTGTSGVDTGTGTGTSITTTGTSNAVGSSNATNGELPVAVDHNQLLTMASETVDPII